MEAVQAKLGEVPGWDLDGAAIRRTLTFATFSQAVAFVVRLAFEAEAADHHPDILICYRRVTLSWTTHSAHGLTEKDFEGAATSDRLAARFLQE